LKERKFDLICFLILNNNFYMAWTEEGTTILERRGDDGTYHMDGDLTVISKTAQHSIFNNLRPLLDACGGKSFILASPIQRYLYRGCCQDMEHMANCRDPGFTKELVESLKDGARNLRDFLFTAGYKNGRILDSCRSLRDGEAMWTDDPVHPAVAAYEKLAEGVGMVAANIRPGGNKRRRDSLNSEPVVVMKPGKQSHGGSNYRDCDNTDGDDGDYHMGGGGPGGSRGANRGGGLGVVSGGRSGDGGGRSGGSRGGGSRAFSGSSGPRRGRRF
jgi:hypothetical protein